LFLAKILSRRLKEQIPILSLTTTGKELLKMLSITPIDKCINNFYLYLQKTGFIVEKNFA